MANHFIDNFIRELHPEEIKTITRYLKNNATYSDGGKTVEVFNKMISGIDFEYETETGLNKIKSRVLEKSLDALMMEDHSDEEAFCEFDQTVLKLKKQLIQCKLLQRTLTKNKIKVTQHLLNQIISEAKKNEIYNTLLEALILKKYFISIRTGIEEFEKTHSEIFFYDNCNKALLNAIDMYYRLMLNTTFTKSHTKEELNNYFELSIKQMENDYKTTTSQQINYYLHIMKFAYFEHTKDYANAIDYCHKLIVLMKKHSFIYRKERMGFALDNLSQFYVFTENYSEAIKCSIKAQSHYLPNSSNLITSFEQQFHAYFYNKRYAKAMECLKIILNHPTFDMGNFRKSKYVFFQACTLFAQKRFKEAFTLLQEPLEIEKDKTRWNISLRILNIMLLLELKRLSDAGRAVEALRKFVQRTVKNNEISSRDLLIVETLLELERTEFEYSCDNKSLNNMLLKLSEKNTKVSWEYYTSELIPFHEWLSGRKEDNLKIKKKIT